MFFHPLNYRLFLTTNSNCYKFQLCKMQTYPTILLFFVSWPMHTAYARIDCDNVVTNNDEFTGYCDNKWKNLKSIIMPMQSQVGHAWVKYKANNHFNSESNAQQEMDDTPVPCVIAPDSQLYVVDHHHELSALDYSEFSDVLVTVDVICDLRSLASMDMFWEEMKNGDMTYLAIHPSNNSFELPVPIDPSELPRHFSFTKKNISLSDDPWRALASYARKSNSVDMKDSCDGNDSKLCGRCFYRGCVDGSQLSGPGFPFFEFRWAYFMLYGTYFDPSYWPSSTNRNEFMELFNSSTVALGSLDTYNIDDWLLAASYLGPLCRSDKTETYLVPDDIFSEETALPGYVPGHTKLDDDPECDAPTCKV